MSAPGFPKEFGDRSDVGLGKLRGLHDTDVPFMKSLPDGDTVVVKGNGFDTVTKKPPLPGALAQYVSSAQFAVDYGYVDAQGQTYATTYQTLCLTGAKGAPMRRFLAAGGAGYTYSGLDGRYYGLSSGLIIMSIQNAVTRSSPFQKLPGVVSQVDVYFDFMVIRLYPYGKFDKQNYEASDRYGATRVTNSLFTNKLLHSHVTRTGTKQSPVEHECITYATYDPDLGAMVPRAGQTTSRAGWLDAGGLVGYADYDHFTAYMGWLLPSLCVICHVPCRLQQAAVYEVGATYIASGLPVYPGRDAAVARTNALTNYYAKKPLFQFSVNSGVSYAVTNDFDYLFDGAYYASVAADVDELVYFQAMNTFSILRMLASSLLCVEMQLKTATVNSIVRGGKIFEYRLYRTLSTNFGGGFQVPLPPGYGTVWGAQAGALYPVFACSLKGKGQGLIGYAATPSNLNSPTLLYVSADEGSTWLPPRSLPGSAATGGTVQQLTETELCYVVFNATSGTATMYISADFGLSWQRRAPTAGVAPQSFAPMLDVQRVITENGVRPCPTPMTPWLYDMLGRVV